MLKLPCTLNNSYDISNTKETDSLYNFSFLSIFYTVEFPLKVTSITTLYFLILRLIPSRAFKKYIYI